jgi:hypothetical protein
MQVTTTHLLWIEKLDNGMNLMTPECPHSTFHASIRLPLDETNHQEGDKSIFNPTAALMC